MHSPFDIKAPPQHRHERATTGSYQQTTKGTVSTGRSLPKDKLTAKMQTIRDERDKLLAELDRIDADLKVARDIISTALTLLAKPQRLYKAMTDS
jgi:hypothetical protein